MKRSQFCVAIAVASLGGLVPCVARAQLAADEPSRLFEMRNWLTGLNQPTDIAFAPDGRAIVALRSGEIVVRTRDGILHFDAGNFYLKTGHLESGLIGLSTIPGAVVDYGMGPEYPLVTVSTGIDANKREKIWIHSGRLMANNEVFLAPARPLLELSPRSAGHYGGGLIVRGDEIYVSIGDSSSPMSPPINRNASCLNHPHGKILRIKIDGSIPPDNPLVDFKEVSGCAGPTEPIEMMPPDRRIFAWGLRNPWRFWVDPITHLLWIGDVGERTREEISIGGSGQHFGYPFFEASVSYDQPFSPRKCEGLLPSVPCTPPVYEWTNGRAIGADPLNEDRASIGGLIPDEDGHLCGWPSEWKGRYFFGDYGSGQIRTLGVAQDRRSIAPGDVSTFGTVRGVTGFRMGPDNALYIVSNGGGSIVRVIPRDHARAGCPALPAPVDAAVEEPADAAIADTDDSSARWDTAIDVADVTTPTFDAEASIGNSADVRDETADVSDDAVGKVVSSSGGCGCHLDRTHHSRLGVASVLSVLFIAVFLRRRTS